jgi:hypothetical protein
VSLSKRRRATKGAIVIMSNDKPSKNSHKDIYSYVSQVQIENLSRVMREFGILISRYSEQFQKSNTAMISTMVEALKPLASYQDTISESIRAMVSKLPRFDIGISNITHTLKPLIETLSNPEFIDTCSKITEFSEKYEGVEGFDEALEKAGHIAVGDFETLEAFLESEGVKLPDEAIIVKDSVVAHSSSKNVLSSVLLVLQILLALFNLGDRIFPESDSPVESSIELQQANNEEMRQLNEAKHLEQTQQLLDIFERTLTNYLNIIEQADSAESTDPEDEPQESEQSLDIAED